MCIDIDNGALARLRKELDSSLLRRVTTIRSDFTKWASAGRGRRFDCVLMNPPFAARKRDWVECHIQVDGTLHEKVAAEVAFVYCAFRKI